MCMTDKRACIRVRHVRTFVMDIAELRSEMGLSLEAFAERLGLKSKAYAHEIESTGKCTVRIALKIEELSEGRIAAASLNPDVGLVEAARGVGEAAA